MIDETAADIDRIMDVMALAFDPAFGEAWTRRQVVDALTIGNCRYGLLDEHGNRPVGDAVAAGFFMIRGLFDEAELLLLAVRPRCVGVDLAKSCWNHLPRMPDITATTASCWK